MDYSNADIEKILMTSDMQLTSGEVCDAVRRGWTELSTATDTEIVDHFAGYSADSMVGVVSNVKGIALEMEVERALDNSGINANIFELTNNPGTDIFLGNGQEYSVKSGVSDRATLEDISEGLTVIATSEIADKNIAIDAGISSAALAASVIAALAS